MTVLPHKSVLTCINEPGITEVVTRCLQSEFANQYALSVAESRYIDKFLALAQSATPDLFILLLNNMFYSDEKFYSENRSSDVRLNVIAQLKDSYQKPVIAMTGLPGIYTEDNTRKAGASFYFVIPVERVPLMNAVRQCFEETEPAHL